MTRVTKGKRRKAKLVCSNAKVAAAAHPYVSVDQEELESAFKSSWQALLADVPAGDAGGTLDVICRDLEGAVFATEDKLERMAGDYERRPSSILAAKLQAVEAELSSLRESLAETEERRAIADGGLIHARLGQLPDVMEAEGGERAPINAVLRSLFAGVTIDHAAGLLRFAWKQGGESVIVYAMPDASHEAEVLSHAA